MERAIYQSKHFHRQFSAPSKLAVAGKEGRGTSKNAARQVNGIRCFDIECGSNLGGLFDDRLRDLQYFDLNSSEKRIVKAGKSRVIFAKWLHATFQSGESRGEQKASNSPERQKPSFERCTCLGI